MMLPSNFVFQIYKQQEREYIQKVEQSRMICEAEKQPGTTHRQYFLFGQRLAERISSLARSMHIDKTYQDRASCPAS